MGGWVGGGFILLGGVGCLIQFDTVRVVNHNLVGAHWWEGDETLIGFGNRILDQLIHIRIKWMGEPDVDVIPELQQHPLHVSDGEDILIVMDPPIWIAIILHTRWVDIRNVIGADVPTGCHVVQEGDCMIRTRTQVHGLDRVMEPVPSFALEEIQDFLWDFLWKTIKEKPLVVKTTPDDVDVDFATQDETLTSGHIADVLEALQALVKPAMATDHPGRSVEDHPDVILTQFHQAFEVLEVLDEHFDVLLRKIIHTEYIRKYPRCMKDEHIRDADRQLKY